MVTKEQHEAVVGAYLRAVEYFDCGGEETIMLMNGFSRAEHQRLAREARKKRTTKGDLVRDTMIRHMEEARAKGEVNFDDIEDKVKRTPEEVEAFKGIGRILKNARVFEIPGPAFKEIMVAANACAEAEIVSAARTHVNPHAAELLRKHLNKKPEELPASVSFEDKFIMGRATQTAVEVLQSFPFPENLPFDACFFATTEPILFDGKTFDVEGEIGFRGILVSPQTCCMVMDRHPTGDTSFLEYFPVTLYRDGQWIDIWRTRAPWHVETLVRLINEHKKIVVERPRGLSEKMLWDKMRKKHGLRVPPPPPFYVVNLTDEYIEQNSKSLFPPRKIDWSHRWDVRGHEVVRIQRGSLPLPEKHERDLLKRKYKVWKTENPDADTWRLLSERRLPPKRVDEWLAVLVTWRNPFVKGPEDKPYVPATHRVPQNTGGGDWKL